MSHGVPCPKINGRSISTMPEYYAWKSIYSRCVKGIHTSAYRYFGIIQMCDAWKNSFYQFYKDMGPRPNNKYSIDRINVHGHYEPSNCRWASREIQNANKGKFHGKRTSKYKGVYYNKEKKKYQARLNYKCKKYYGGTGCGGYFLSEKDAAKAYNDLVDKIIKKDVYKNKIED